MSTRLGAIDPVAHIPANRSALRRGALLMLTPLVVYVVAHPMVHSDALALALGGTIPVLYSLVLALGRHRVDPIALVSTIGFSLACVATVATGGSSLPLKLHEAAITFTAGLAMLVAVLVGRPLPLAKPLRVPSATKPIESSLGVMIGAFLVLHALLHLALAASLSTGAYLIASRVVNWGTLALGIAGLSLYLRRLRERASDSEETGRDRSRGAGGTDRARRGQV